MQVLYCIVLRFSHMRLLVVQVQVQLQVHEGVLTTSVGVKPTSELALQLQGYLASFGIFRTSF